MSPAPAPTAAAPRPAAGQDLAPRGADLVVRALEAHGVKRIFSLSGNHIMPVYDALLETDIALVHVRQEAAAVHMADAHARLTGEVGVALVTGGQGLSNGAAALFTALGAESPVLLLSGQAGIGELGRGAFQEMDQAAVARPMAKASWMVESAEALGADIARAIRIAREGRPGPVHLALPVDLLEKRLAASQPTVTIEEARTSPEEEAIAARLAALLESADRPLMLCGPALCTPSGRQAMARLEAATGVPVIGMESPRGVNDPGLGAFAELLAGADLVVLLGKALDFTLKFGAPPTVAASCRFAVVDADPHLLARAVKAKGALLVERVEAEAGRVLAALAASPPAAAAARASWLAQAKEALAFVPAAWASARAASGRIHPVELCAAVRDFLARHPDGTLVCDGGEIGQWPQAIVKTQNRIINGVSGTIGASIPFAIAARLARPEAPVVAVMGDGTFGFHMAEFDTAVRVGAPFIAVIGNDARWNAEHQIQLRTYGAERTRYCDLLPTRYDEVVRALGGYGALVTDAADLPEALAEAHASGLPAAINVMIEGFPAPVIRRG
ncbi:acetolactate synthase-1/2/3 large subunit [Xanthobacter sp. SG618]|uniref:thiamine pyrophosphate-binding protein n=1 Tax=Xanthobacter sp. SG618 TaxID=2587121 RepID=UPI00145D36A6|nr:thiamine pyrophosphate-binding protein [Xanthobacter sp. SG618]NMN60440.1 acetolactate synthase-1/2/3 large subunit [Xanthobacter sp. SG618]